MISIVFSRKKNLEEEVFHVWADIPGLIKKGFTEIKKEEDVYYVRQFDSKTMLVYKRANDKVARWQGEYLKDGKNH